MRRIAGVTEQIAELVMNLLTIAEFAARIRVSKSMAYRLVEEQQVFRILLGEPLAQLYHRIREVNNPGLAGFFPGLMLPRRQDETGVALGKVFGGHLGDFARPGARRP